MGARGLMSLLFHGDKAVEVLSVALESGLLARLDAAREAHAWVTLGELSDELAMVPQRLHKLLDALEAMVLVERCDPASNEPLDETRYRSAEPLARAAEQVVGTESIERDRDGQPWRALHGRLREVLHGGAGIPAEDFAWPPATPEQVARFARSMAAGIAPIAESFRVASRAAFGKGEGPIRVLDVGGGNGTLARALAEHDARLHVDVYELPELEPLARATYQGSNAQARLGFRAGDVFRHALPEGYDVISFVRILHDWPADDARRLLSKAFDALAPGGRVIVCEELRNPERAAIQFFWSYFLVGVDSCTSRLREWARYDEWLRELGFDDVTLLPGPFDIGVATRPD
ncbi:MAG: methyltransferase domain-containing protein [Sandaracinus sp.]|nr:methyltransferase domain-containing protein [Myxococcales bacterium]MCB9604191.1 methyltransferase domain-containing protein [Sandaracinus sp.]MCB9616860.1 methyltransferase domain-containing protein [Sandaracinus sp.]